MRRINQEVWTGVGAHSRGIVLDMVLAQRVCLAVLVGQALRQGPFVLRTSHSATHVEPFRTGSWEVFPGGGSHTSAVLLLLVFAFELRFLMTSF